MADQSHSIRSPLFFNQRKNSVRQIIGDADNHRHFGEERGHNQHRPCDERVPQPREQKIVNLNLQLATYTGWVDLP